MRQVKIQDKKLFAILEMRGETFKEIEGVNKIIVKEDEKRTKLSYRMQRLKDKTSEALKNHVIELNEFEQIGSVGIENGESTVSIYDELEEYKKTLRDRKEKKKDKDKTNE